MFRTLSLISLLLLSFNAQAAFLIEPYLGYKAHASGDRNLAGAHTDYTYRGPTLGGRVGYQFLGLMAGLDYSASTFDLERETTTSGVTTTTKDDYSQSTFGFFVGYNLPLLLRAWGAYYLSTSYEDQDGTNKGQKFKGQGYGAGIGFTGLPFVSLNLELRRLQLDEFEDPTSTTSRVVKYSGSASPEITEIFLSVSLPLTF